MDLFTPNFTPKNQHELVIHTLIEFRRSQFELSQLYWMEVYKTSKFNTRLGEVERMCNKKLVDRKLKPFVNRFGHDSKYMVYIPILNESEYMECLSKIKKEI